MRKFLGLAALLVLLIPGLVRAQLNITAQIGGIPTVSGATLLNFDGSLPSLMALAGGASLVTGTDYPITYAAPCFSGSTAAFFGESPANGPDSSQYVAVEANSSATFNFSTPQDYFGLLWGSVDQYNDLAFYDNFGNLIGTVTGTDAIGPNGDFGDVGPDGTYYVNITSSIPFSKVVATSPIENAFEFDDVAIGASVVPVPEPTTSALMACGLGVVFLALNRKRA